MERAAARWIPPRATPRLLHPALPGVDDAELAGEHGEPRGEIELARAGKPALEHRRGGGERARASWAKPSATWAAATLHG